MSLIATHVLSPCPDDTVNCTRSVGCVASTADPNELADKNDKLLSRIDNRKATSLVALAWSAVS